MSLSSDSIYTFRHFRLRTDTKRAFNYHIIVFENEETVTEIAALSVK